jgi:trk system potassium uptake protein TrkA
MTKPGEIAVIGLGRFGRALVTALVAEGQSVLAIDLDPQRVELLADVADEAMALDATDEDTLAGLHLERMSCVVVAIGGRATEASILTTALLRQLGVPRIVGRALNELHARVLRAVGAQEVINPEAEAGRRLALRLANPGIVDQIALGDATIAEVETPAAFYEQSLAELDLRNRLGVTVLAVRGEGSLRVNPAATERLAAGDVLVVLGLPAAIKRLSALA